VTAIDSLTTYYPPAAKVAKALAFSSHPRVHISAEAALGDQDFFLNGHGSQTRNFTHVQDTEGTMLAAGHGSPGGSITLAEAAM
jgi:hypothetical protein